MEKRDPLHDAKVELAARTALDKDRRRQEREKALTVLKGEPWAPYVDLGILAVATMLCFLLAHWIGMTGTSLVPAFMFLALAVRLARAEVRLQAAAKLIVELVERPSGHAGNIDARLPAATEVSGTAR